MEIYSPTDRNKIKKSIQVFTLHAKSLNRKGQEISHEAPEGKRGAARKQEAIKCFAAEKLLIDMIVIRRAGGPHPMARSYFVQHSSSAKLISNCFRNKLLSNEGKIDFSPRWESLLWMNNTIAPPRSLIFFISPKRKSPKKLFLGASFMVRGSNKKGSSKELNQLLLP